MVEKVIYKLDSYSKPVFTGPLPTTKAQFKKLDKMLTPFAPKKEPHILVGLVSDVDLWLKTVGRANMLPPMSTTHNPEVYHNFTLRIASNFRPITTQYSAPAHQLVDAVNYVLKGVLAPTKNLCYVGCPYQDGSRTALFVFMSYLLLTPNNHDAAMERTLHNCPTFKNVLSKFPDLTRYAAGAHAG